MVYVIFLSDTVIARVYTELGHVLAFIKSGERHHKIEVWNNGERRGGHLY